MTRRTRLALWVLLPIILLPALQGAAESPFSVPVTRWTSAFDSGLDVALAIDASRMTIVVVGTTGVVFYNADGSERAVVLTGEPQSAVRLLGETAFVGGTSGLAAYTSDGRLLWSLPLAKGCQGIAPAGDGLLLLTGGDLRTCTLSGELGDRWTLGFDATTLAGLGPLTALAGDGRVALFRHGILQWTRSIPFAASDIAVDAWGNVWVVGDGVLALLSPASGTASWVRRVPGIAAAVSAMLEPGDSILGAQAPGAVVTGYRDSGEGLDFITTLVSRDGLLIWSVICDGGHGDDFAHDVAVLPDGDVVITGIAPCAHSAESGDDYLTVRYSSDPSGSGPQSPLPEAIPPVADFAWDTAAPRSFDWITFESLSMDPDGVIVLSTWVFDEHHQDVGEKAAHAFIRSGAYDVTLVVQDEHGLTASCTKRLVVENRPPTVTATALVQAGTGELTADFTWDVERETRGTYPAGFDPENAADVDDVHFTDLSTGGPSFEVSFDAETHDADGSIADINWSFGDNAHGRGASPVHVYSSAGTYTVTVYVVDNEGAQTSLSFPVVVGGSGGIVAWEWMIGGPGEYVDGTSSSSQHPEYGFDDQSGEGPFEVALTVWDASGGSASATQWIAVDNVPPAAAFASQFTGEPILAPSDEMFWFGESNYVAQEPDLPPEAGVVAFTDESHDGEPWLSIQAWQWDFDGSWTCWTGEDCETADSPSVLLTWGGEGGDRLFRGTRNVTLWVWDDDGEGGDNGYSSVMHEIEVANIAPYAGFEWWHSEWASSVTPTCTGGDPSTSDSDGPFSVTREVESWDPGGAVFVPWRWSGQITLTLTSSGGSVDILETAPAGWSISYWGEDLTTDGATLSGTVALSEGSAVVYYDIYPPSDDTAAPGMVSIGGVFTNTIPTEGDPEVYTVELDSDVVLCTTADVDSEVDFRAFGDGDASTGYVDPNGDGVTFSWDFGAFGTDTEQWLVLPVHFDDVEVSYNGWEWVWNGAMSAELTVTDDEGASTSVETEIELEGSCSGGAPG